MKRHRLGLSVTAAAAAFCLGACTAEAPVSDTFFAMDTVMTVTAYGENAAQAVKAAEDRVRGLEDLLSVTNGNSDISHINSVHGASTVVSGETAELITDALGVCKETGGALDVTIYPVLLEWGFTTSEYHVPDAENIEAALAKTGYERVTVSGDAVSVPDGFMLDLGSCAKGHASDVMLDELSERGITSALVNLGGNVKALGSKPDGSGWKVGITDPFSPNELIGTIEVNGKAVVTSGGYQRYFTDDDGNRYIHIIDPATGRPAESGLASVTVIGSSGLLCDALSTAFFVMGRDKTEAYLADRPDIAAVLVTDDGTIAVSGSIYGSFTCLSGRTPEVIKSR